MKDTNIGPLRRRGRGEYLAVHTMIPHTGRSGGPSWSPPYARNRAGVGATSISLQPQPVGRPGHTRPIGQATKTALLPPVTMTKEAGEVSGQEGNRHIGGLVLRVLQPVSVHQLKVWVRFKQGGSEVAQARRVILQLPCWASPLSLPVCMDAFQVSASQAARSALESVSWLLRHGRGAPAHPQISEDWNSTGKCSRYSSYRRHGGCLIGCPCVCRVLCNWIEGDQTRELAEVDGWMDGWMVWWKVELDRPSVLWNSSICLCRMYLHARTKLERFLAGKGGSPGLMHATRALKFGRAASITVCVWRGSTTHPARTRRAQASRHFTSGSSSQDLLAHLTHLTSTATTAA